MFYSPTHSARRRYGRNGTTTMELAIVATPMFLLVLSLVEFGRLSMVSNTLTHAAIEACRAGIVPGSTVAEVAAEAQDVLAGGLVGSATVIVTPPQIASLQQGETVSVRVEVPFGQVSWLPVPQWIGSYVVQGECTMVREGV